MEIISLNAQKRTEMKKRNAALRDAALNPTEVQYLNAHATSTPLGDRAETAAVKATFGEHAYKLAVSSTKSMMGHTFGAAGAIEGMMCTLAISEGRIPPTINLDNLDPGCVELGLDFTPNHAVKKKLQYALSNSFGFGGTNSTVIFNKICFIFLNLDNDIDGFNHS